MGPTITRQGKEGAEAPEDNSFMGIPAATGQSESDGTALNSPERP